MRVLVMASWPTFLAAGGAGLLLCQMGAGLLMVMSVLVGLPLIVSGAVACVRHPSRRPVLLPKVLLWTLSLTLAAVVQCRIDSRSRDQAQLIVVAVEAYHARHGEYPRDLAQLGFTPAGGGPMGLPGRYVLAGGRPSFSYPSTWVTFDRHVYDFEARAWQYVPD